MSVAIGGGKSASSARNVEPRGGVTGARSVESRGGKSADKSRGVCIEFSGGASRVLSRSKLFCTRFAVTGMCPLFPVCFFWN